MLAGELEHRRTELDADQAHVGAVELEVAAGADGDFEHVAARLAAYPLAAVAQQQAFEEGNAAVVLPGMSVPVTAELLRRRDVGSKIHEHRDTSAARVRVQGPGPCTRPVGTNKARVLRPQAAARYYVRGTVVVSLAPDRSGPIRSLNPLDSPYRLLIRTSVGLALLLGFSLGVYLVLGFAFGLPISGAAPALIQVHGQVQLMGFVLLYVVAVAVQLFPRFHANPLRDPRHVSLGGLAIALGIVLRVLAQPVPTELAIRGPLLLIAALLELAGAALVVRAFGKVVFGSVQRPRGGFAVLLPATMGSSLTLSLALNLWISLGLAQGALVAPPTQDEALLRLQVWGFASSMVLAVSGRVYPRFLLLQPTREGWLRSALVLWAIGNFGVALTWFVLAGQPAARLVFTIAQLAGACLYVLALRLYEAPARPSGMPHVTAPTRLWARLAYAFLLVGGAIDVAVAAVDLVGGASTATQISAGRHAVAQGFLLPVMVYMAARILPGYSGEMMRKPRVLGALIWSLFAGAALRVVFELYGGYAPGFGALVALGGTLTAAAFTVFAIGLWRTTGRAPGI